MPNFLYPFALNNFAVFYSKNINERNYRRWFQRSVIRWVQNNPDCAIQIEVKRDNFPEWANKCLDEGRQVHNFHASSEVVEQIKYVRQWILSMEKADFRDIGIDLCRLSKRRLNGLNNTNFEQAHEFAGDWFRRIKNYHEKKDNLNTIIFKHIRIESINGRYWLRITNISDISIY